MNDDGDGFKACSSKEGKSVEAEHLVMVAASMTLRRCELC